MGEPNLARRLRVYSRLDEKAVGIIQQGAFAEEKRTVVLQGKKDDDVGFLKRVTRLAPLQFFGQAAIKQELSQELQLFLPFFGFFQVGIDLRIRSAFGHTNGIREFAWG
jgi:hypothetical protein